jgi:peptidoglycan/LPS O-acetylase OafA/YrhL
MLVKLNARVCLTAVAACALLFGTHPMFLFVIGHLCAGWLRHSPKPPIGAGLIVLGFTLSATKNWDFLETARGVIARYAPSAAPNLFQFESQLAAIALFMGVLLSPAAQWLLMRCHQLGRLSFSIYLLHFPILFTLACAGFIDLADALPRLAAVGVTFVGFAVLVLAAATVFERVVDRRAVRIGRLIDPPALTAQPRNLASHEGSHP